MNDLNQIYFDMLLEKSKVKNDKNLILHEPEKNIDSHIICIPIATDEDLESITIKKYESLSNTLNEKLSDFTYTLIKMQAGLGSSVKRGDLIELVEDRSELGAKGTDLYFEVDNNLEPIAKIQLMQANRLSESNIFKKIKYKNLVNEETEIAVNEISKTFNTSSSLEIEDSYFQKKMPTLDESGNLTNDRMAPAGHGFIGVATIVETFLNKSENEVVAIGNGEDLGSTPDIKTINWVIENNLPIVMITTTKTIQDKKGGQISIVKAKPDYITIVEKAQAEASNQLEYFEQLGLRENDRESLFNTNIVIINKKALKEKFDEFILDYTQGEFLASFAPDVIFNKKLQDGKEFTQLESALGSVVLNLDKFFRQNFETPLVSFLNLNPEDRKAFFMPIKKREDYEEIISNFEVDHDTYRLIPKSK